MVVQQHVGNLTTAKPSIAELNSKLRASNKSDTSTTAGAAADQPVSALAKALKTVEGTKSPEGAYPPGTVHLARGGQILDELAALDKNLGVMDGEAVDLSVYPQLGPLHAQLKTTAAPEVLISKEDESTQLDTKDIQIDCTTESTTTAAATDTTAEETGASVDSTTALTENADMEATAEAEATSTDGPPPFPVVSSPKPPTARSRLSSLLDWSEAFKGPSEAVATNTVHLVVLQHGFLGLSYDMQLIENSLRLEMAGSVEVMYIAYAFY